MTIKTYDIVKLTEQSSTTLYMDDVNRWDSPSISVYRGYRDLEEGETLLSLWQFHVSHSSSSSGAKNVDSLLQTGLMIAQLTDAVDTMRDMMNRVNEFEAAYQAHKAAQRAAWEAEQAARKAKEGADTQLTPSQVGHLIATICVDIKHGGKYKVVKLCRNRGCDTTVRLVATKTMGGAVQFKLGGTLYSKAKLAQALERFAEITDVEVTA